MTLRLNDLTTEFIDAMEQASVWQPASAAQEPKTKLTQWRVYKVTNELEESIHFVGYAGYEGRVSSSVKNYNPVAKTGVTQSGRVYELLHHSGHNGDAMYTFNRWCSRFPKDTKFTDITEQYE